MSDAWAEIQALKSKRESRRIRLEERKKERQDILTRGLGDSPGGTPGGVKSENCGPSGSQSSTTDVKLGGGSESPANSSMIITSTPINSGGTPRKYQGPAEVKVKTEGELKTEQVNDVSFEDFVLQTLSDVALRLPMDSKQLLGTVNKALDTNVTHLQIFNLLQKFAVQQLISIEEKLSDGGSYIEIITADHTKLLAMVSSTRKKRRKDDVEDDSDEEGGVGGAAEESKRAKEGDNDVLSLLSLASTREKENKRIGEEILELLSRPSVKEKTLAERFRSQGGSTVKEFCPQGTRTECCRVSATPNPCGRLHFRKIIQSHTDESLGDCSFLNTCFHMETCKYVHYEVESEDRAQGPSGGNDRLALLSPHNGGGNSATSLESQTVPNTVLHPAQWIQCDLRFFDMTALGKFSVIMADPPWDIHMELPYGTLSDDEMRQLNIPGLQDEGLIFLWVTGRAMELGRECLELWGYERVDELIWVKTNQLQRIIRTGRTGHWLNHGKEHCLVGMKGNPPVNRGLDCDVIVAEVRATSHKPDEIYGIIERLSPGTRKIELFGRPHNIQPNWITLGNQLAGTHIVEDDIRKRVKGRYPDDNYGANKNSGK